MLFGDVAPARIARLGRYVTRLLPEPRSNLAAVGPVYSRRRLSLHPV
jgi:hypothetical protein